MYAFRGVGFGARVDLHGAGGFAASAGGALVFAQGVAQDGYAVEYGVYRAEWAEVFAEGAVNYD
jgi:hypothetical protein